MHSTTKSILGSSQAGAETGIHPSKVLKGWRWRNLPGGYGKWSRGTPTSPIPLWLRKKRQMHIELTADCTALLKPPPKTHQRSYQLFNICRNPGINQTLEHVLNSPAPPTSTGPLVMKHNYTVTWGTGDGHLRGTTPNTHGVLMSCKVLHGCLRNINLLIGIKYYFYNIMLKVFHNKVFF